MVGSENVIYEKPLRENLKAALKALVAVFFFAAGVESRFVQDEPMLIGDYTIRNVHWLLWLMMEFNI